MGNLKSPIKSACDVLRDATIKHIENTQFQLVDSFNNSYCVNRLIDARINEIKINDNALFQSLIANNLATKFHYGNLELECLKIDENFCSINKDNKTIDRLFILGLPTEGIKFYTFILPRPHIASTFLCDSNKAVDSLIKRTQA